MVYVDKGKVKIKCDDEEIVLGQGEIVFHRPDEFHSIRALDSAPNYFLASFVCNSPAMQYFEKYHTMLDKTLKSFISSVIKEAERTYIIPKNDPNLKKLVKKPDAPIGGEQLIETYLEQLMIFLIRSITKKGETNVFPTKESMENHLVKEIKEQLENNSEGTLRVSDICASLGYSKSYLSRLFREQTGETIANYSVRVKINKSKQMIHDGRLNFAQISDSLSFDNPQYFSRVFKHITGMSPTEFKNSLDV